jgi:hypothetical protein
MDRPSPNPTKLLEIWMEWERGESTPGRVLADLKIGGLRDILEQLASAAEDHPLEATEETSTDAWKPVV